MREWLGPNAWGTFFVNVTGALVLGLGRVFPTIVISDCLCRRSSFVIPE